LSAIKVAIKGKVQGVFFRQSARKVADSLKLEGWIKNLANGDVLAQARGDKDSLENFIAWCKLGPPRAQVSDVDITWLDELNGEFPSSSQTQGFKIIG